MSESESAVARGDVEDDCPICQEPLPPFWDWERRSVAVCCGKAICKNCREKRDAVLQRAEAEGTYGRQEEQLNRTCPLCRTPLPESGHDEQTRMLDKFEKGQLPLHMYSGLGVYFIDGIAGTFIDGTQGVEVNVERGVEILLLGANKGDPNCQYMIGHRYWRGLDGLTKSTTEAKRWLLAAAEQGHAMAEYNLAVMMRDEGNDEEYLRYLRGSASKGCNGACYNFGVDYYEGNSGLRRSSEEAIRVLTPAAERGDAASMGLLGRFMCCPEPDMMIVSKPNFTKGVHWVRRAAEKGDEDSISNLRQIEEVASSMCFRCNKEAPPEKSLLRCSRCRAAWYCSKDCQRRHWKAEGGHKQRCIKWE